MKSKVVYFLVGIAFIMGIIVSYIYYSNEIKINPEETPDILVVLKTMDPEKAFWQAVRDGIVSASNDYNVKVNFTGPMLETDIDGQISAIINGLEQKPDAVILAATDFNRLVPIAQEIKDMNIPLVTMDSFINSSQADSEIGTDNFEAGKKAGGFLIDFLNPGDKVAIISHVKESSTAIERESGVRDVLEKRVSIIGTFYSQDDRLIAYSITEKIINDEPNLKAILTLNDPTTIGAADALRDLEKENEIILVGFDNSYEVIRAVELNIVKATVVQKPFNMGFLAVKTAYELIQHKNVSRLIDTGSVLITKDNIFTIENQKLLFPVRN
jgi:ribose transport system substrate-binding protein